jgi:hypothetical protein
MHKLIGEFDNTLALVLTLESTHKVSKDLFEKLKKYIQGNMFLSFRRQSAKCRKIVLSSVGDHLSKDDEQDILKADLFIDIEVIKDIPQLTYDKLMRQSYWLVLMNLQKGEKLLEQIEIKINKSDDLISFRKHTKHATK